MKTSEAFPSKYLKAADLGDKTWQLVIDEYQMEEFQELDGSKRSKPVLYFRRTQKGLVLNKVNTRTIETILGTDEMNDWIGQTVSLYAREVEARGAWVNAIRVVSSRPGQSTAPSHHQPRPAPAPGFTSGLPGKEAQPAPRKPAAEHVPVAPAEAYTEANPPPNTGQGYRGDMDDEIPFAPEWR